VPDGRSILSIDDRANAPVIADVACANRKRSDRAGVAFGCVVAAFPESNRWE
jgi:hypothetical protein